jgi:hypothetical protein
MLLASVIIKDENEFLFSMQDLIRHPGAENPS